MPLNYYERKLYELLKGLTEADKFYARNPDGKKISVFTHKDNYEDAVKSGGYDPVDREEAEAELSGQTGEKPAEKPKPKQAKIAADPFDDKEKEAPKKPATTYTKKEVKRKKREIMDDLLDDLIDNYDGNFDKWMKTGATQLPGHIEDALGELEGMSNSKKVDKFKQKAYDEMEHYVVMQGFDQGLDKPAAEKQPQAGPDKTYSSPEKGIEQNAEEIADLFNQRIEEPEDVQAHDEMQSTLMDIFQDDELVTSMMEIPPEDYKNAQQFIDNLKDTADKIGESNMKGVPSQFPESELAEEPFEYDDYDEDMENEIADEVVAYFVDNADKEAMKDYTEEEMMDFVQAQSERLVAKYQQPDGVPNEKRSMLAYRNDLIDNVRFELGYADGEAGFDADDGPKESVQPFKEQYNRLFESLGGI